MIENLLWDTRLALRTLTRSPGFSSVTIVLMALGIATTTTLFSVTYGVLLKPLQWSDPDRIVRLQEMRGGTAGRVPWTVTNTTYHAWRDEPTTIEAIGGWTRTRVVNVSLGGRAPERLRVASVTPSLFGTVGVSPVAGRVFSDEDVNSRRGVMVLGFSVWQRRFGGRADVIGQTLHLDGNLVTIVGVMPAHFRVPDREAEAWVPLRIPRVDPHGESISGMIFNAVARLRAGVTPAQAAAEATARGRAAPSLRQAGAALFGSDGEINVLAVPAREALTAEVRPALLILLAAVALLFTTTVASVLLIQSARAVRRRREFAVRAAIGAGSGRLVGSWLVESAVLGILGGGVGVALSAFFHRAIPLVLPPDFPRTDDVALDVRVTLFSVGLTLLAILVCGIVPALQSRDTSLQATLSSDGIASGKIEVRGRGRYVRAAMMVVQVAIACILLVGTGLLARSFVALLSADRGFDPRNVMTAYASRPGRPFAADAASLERAQDRMRSLPGVTHVAFANALPFVTRCPCESTSRATFLLITGLHAAPESEAPDLARAHPLRRSGRKAYSTRLGRGCAKPERVTRRPEMRHRFFVLWALAAVIAVALLAPASAAGQARTATDRWTAPRTPWGHPDLQGTWTNTTTTRLERPSELAAKAVLTERERATLDEQAAQRQDRRPPPGSTGAYNSFWMEGGKASRQASLVMDPPDGRLPFTPEARKRADAFTATISGSGTADSWEDRNLYERCITRGLPGAIDAETIDYQITVNDPDAFTRPWTAAMPMNRIQGPLFEYACHEGNYGLEDILKGARTQEKAATKTESR